MLLVVDGRGGDTLALAQAALEQLAGRDRVAVWDTAGARSLLPFLPASNRSMVLAALEKTLKKPVNAPVDLGTTLERAVASVPKTPAVARVLVLTSGASDPYDKAVAKALDGLGKTRLSAVGTTRVTDYGRISALTALSGGVASAAADLDSRIEAVREAVPVSGETAFRDVRLTFEGTPAPSHVLEATGGEVRWRLDAGELALGDVRAGEARTELLRVTVPQWVPGERFYFTVTATLTEGTSRRSFAANVPCVYDDDIERIAKSRHGDVIAYASAMATLKRLDAAFTGDKVKIFLVRPKSFAAEESGGAAAAVEELSVPDTGATGSGFLSAS